MVTPSLTSGRDRLLCEQLVENPGDPARNGLEGLSRDALVRLPQPARERHDELLGHLRVLADQHAHVRRRQRQQLGVLGGLDAGGAALPIEHRQLAEDGTRAERRQRDHPPVGVLPGSPGSCHG